jgi:hypothetical protein
MALMVSRITLTIMIRDVPMKESRLTVNSPDTIIGMTLMIIRPTAPMKIM